MHEYKDHYVAFLDILGFKECLKNNSCETIYSIFSILREKTQKQLNLNGIQIEAYEHIKYTILSDSIIVYIDAGIDDAFSTLLDVCSNLQRGLANLKKPILMRGGIAKGKLFYENDIIYGEGLVRAYLMESNLAKYPRIVFSGDTLSAGKENAKYTFTEFDGPLTNYRLDDDCLYYVEYLASYFITTEACVQYYDRLKALCRSYLNKEIDHALREKYLWLQRKIDAAIRTHSDVREYYKKREEEENERAMQEYNARFSIYPKRFTATIKENEESNDT